MREFVFVVVFVLVLVIVSCQWARGSVVSTVHPVRGSINCPGGIPAQAARGGSYVRGSHGTGSGRAGCEAIHPFRGRVGDQVVVPVSDWCELVWVGVGWQGSGMVESDVM